MAQNEPTWSLGKSKLFTSSGATVTDGDDKWNLGKSVLFHEYVSVGPSGAVLKKYIGGSWVAIDLKHYDSSWVNFTLKKYISGSWQTIDTA